MKRQVIKVLINGSYLEIYN